jgi:hypothetical protein
MVKTMIPMPPSHCVSERHSRRARGAPSTFARTDDPVVVKPATDSNRESATDRVPENT